MMYWAPLALILVTVALLSLAFAPALFELKTRKDAAPLPTSRHNGRITNFAESFESRLETLRPELERCRSTREVCRTRIDGMDVLLVGCDDFDFHPERMRGVAAVMCSQSARVPAGRVIEADVYADGNLELGEGAALRAALATGDIILRENSTVLRWLHAEGNVYLRQRSNAYGRLSARQSILLDRECSFQHIHSRHIFTSEARQGDTHSNLLLPAGCELVSSTPHVCLTKADGTAKRDTVVANTYPRIRIQGDFVLSAGETLIANVIATGYLRFGSGARFFGAAKSYKDTVIDEHACVHGSIICGGTVHLDAGCFVSGPVMAEGDVLMARGSRVGEPDALTTVSSSDAKIAAGCQIHGTIWARAAGNIEG